ncbi:prepilin-type N-terminal cleavage/methylation domain-containing protein [Pasteurella testudinis]|uniref:prepilin-type N-terminal cleavage/methylation domain-containing protein n=1 Tax=Pasteurella testudinis TaxID=761 RepID=UPI004059055E
MIKPPAPALMTINRNKVRFQLPYRNGFGLLELMVATAIGSFLLLVIVAFFTQALSQNRELLLRLQLQQEIQKVLQLMAKDIARSGFYHFHQQVEQSNVDLFNHADGAASSITHANREPENSCLLFWYDLDHSGCIGSNHGAQCQRDERNNTQDIQKELFGYRLKSKMIETRAMYKNGTIQQCDAAQCHAYIADGGCDTRGWTDLLDSDTYQITRLHFSWLANGKGVLAEIEGSYKKQSEIRYQSAVVIPIVNRL